MSATSLVLTYHSISNAGGPTSIPPAVFAMHMRVLAEEGYRGQRLDDFIAWHDGRTETRKHDRHVLITFDDAFADFADVAAPVLRGHDFSAVMFVPTAQIGNGEVWRGAHQPARPLMDWNTIRNLAKDGIEFGGHSRTHADLTTLGAEASEQEIAGCAQELAQRIGREVQSFAAPYGHINESVLDVIARHYRVAFGTRLARARTGRDRYDIPRIEMHYFRSERHWRNLLNARLGYLHLRQTLRTVRTMAGGAFG